MNARASSLALVVFSTAAALAQPTLRLEGPNGTERFYPSDSIRVTWSGNAGLPVRVEVEDENGRRWRFSHAAAGTSFVIAPDALPIGRYRTRLTLIRPDSATIVIPSRPRSPYAGTPAISPDGSELAFASESGLLRIWSMSTGTLLREMAFDARDTPQRVWYEDPHLKYSADGRRLLVTKDFSARMSHILDPATAEVLWSDSSGSPVDMGADGDVVAVGNVVRRISDGATIVTVGDSLTVPIQLLLSPDLAHAVSYSETTIVLWSLTTGRRVYTWYPPYEAELHDVRFRPDGKAVAAVGWEGVINAWDVVTGEHILEARGMPSSYGVSYSPDGLRIAAAHVDGTVRVYDARTGSLLRTIVTSQAEDQKVNLRAEFSGDDSRIVSLGSDPGLRIHELETRLDTVISKSSWDVASTRVTLNFDGDFDRAIFPAGGDSLRTGVLANRETIAMTVSSARIEGADADAFGIVWPRSLPRSYVDSATVQIAFRARHLGPHEATLVIALDTDTVRAALRGIGVRQPVQRRLFRFFFGESRIGQTVDTIVPAIIMNVDSIAHAVSLVLIDGSAPLGFDLLEGGGDFILGPGQTHDVKVRFRGMAFAQHGYSGGLRISYDAIGSPFDIELFGYPNGTLTVAGEENIAGARIIARGEMTTTLRLSTGAREILLVNAVGETRRLLSDIAPGDVAVEHGRLPSGVHMLVVRDARGVVVLPVNFVW